METLIAVELGVLIGLIIIAFIASSTSGELKYKYFVAYNFSSETGSGFGSIDISRSEKVKTFSDIESMRTFIKEKNSFKEVSIMWYTRVV